MSDHKEYFSDWQSAVSGLQAGENITIGDISQSVINSSSARYNHIGVIISEYNRNMMKLERSFKDRSRANQKNMYKELQNCLKDLDRQAEVYKKNIEEHGKTINRIDKISSRLIYDQMKRDGGIFNKDSLFENIKDAVIPGFSIYMFQQNKEQERETERGLEETKQDINELKHLISSTEGFLRLGALELDIDQILDYESLSRLSPCAVERLISVKDAYRNEQQELEDFYRKESGRYGTEKNVSIYREELQYCLDEDGYPLSLAKMRFLESRLRCFNLAKEDIESIAEEIIKPFSIKRLKGYEEVYKSILSQDKFPISNNGIAKLEEVRESLGLNAFRFLQLEVKLIEENSVKPFYQANFQEYQQSYRQKLEQNGLTLSSEDVVQLDELQARLGLKAFAFEDFDVRKVEQELIELVYRENIQKYEREYKQKLDQEGFPLSPTTISELNHFEKTLCLGNFQFQNCPEPVLIKEKLIKPLYQANLQNYSKAYKRKLYQLGVNFAQNKATELEKIRRDFGLDYSYLESLELQNLFNLEEINKIEWESIELVYRENIQSYEQEYKQKLDKEGFLLSYSTISELSHLEEVLGLGSFQFQDCPEPISIKEKLIEPFYQTSLQNYSKEYKRKLYQFGLDLAENHTPEVDKLRNDLGLNSSYVKNLGLQNQFTLEDDLSAAEKTARNLFYTEMLQYYAQEFSREVESSNCFAEQSNNTKESIQALGIRSEDIKVIERLIENNLAIEHLFQERDSEANYWKLINYLAECEWQKADILTRNLLLKLTDRSGKGFLDRESVERISVKDVYTLNRLWVEYSKGLFGFSIQKKIFERVDQKKQPFAEAVGWSNQAGVFKGLFAWKSYNELDFTLNAPKGHLPVWRVQGKEISVDDFSHLKLWDFMENESEPELEADTTEVLLQSVCETNDYKSDSSTTNILSQSFKKIFESINQFEIKKSVDKMGIDGFINHCAILAATTGAASGFGGFTTMIVGVPFDVINNVLQQFRVTLGVIYYKKGVYKVSFAELIKIVGVSIGVEVGATLTKSVMISIANKILVRLSAAAAGKAVPFLGAAIGGSVNYGFVKAIGATVKRIDMNAYTFQSEGSVNELEGQ